MIPRKRIDVGLNRMGADMVKELNTRKRDACLRELSRNERDYLRMGLNQPGGKLPLFDAQGQEIGHDVIQSCIRKGFAEPWFANPLKPSWLVCRLTEQGRMAVKANA